MVRANGKPYRTKAQREGGGKTRREQLREKLQRDRRRRREQNLVYLAFGPAAAKKASWLGDNAPIFGIYEDGSEWVLTGLSVTNKRERMNNHRGGGYTRTEVQGRYASPQTDPHPSEGVPIKRFDTKGAAVDYVSATATSRYEPGAYLVRQNHEPRTRREEVDADGYREFKHFARRVRE